MATQRRPRSDSTAVAVKVFADLQKRIEWQITAVSRMPDPSDDARAQAIFDRIITNRAPDDWRLHDPVLVAQLAVVEVELNRTMQALLTEGWTSMGGKNGTTPVRNRLLDAAQHLSSRQLSLSRALGITGDPVDPRTVKKNAKTAAVARDVSDCDEHSLLA